MPQIPSIGGMPQIPRAKTPKELEEEMKKSGLMSPWDLMNQNNNNNQNNAINGINTQGQNNMQNLAHMGAAGDMMGIVNATRQQATPVGGVTQPATAPMGGTSPVGGVTQPAAAPMGGKPQGLAGGLGAERAMEDGKAMAAPAVEEGAPAEGPQQAKGGGNEATLEETSDSVTVNLGDFENVSGGAPSGSSGVTGGVISDGTEGNEVSGVSGIGNDLLPGKVTGASTLFGSVSKLLNGA